MNQIFNKSNSHNFQEKRSHIRHTSKPLDFAFIDQDSETDGFDPQLIGLIMNESWTGCSLIIKGSNIIQTGKIYQIKLGSKNPAQSKVIWQHALDDEVYKIGFEYIFKDRNQ